MSTKVQRGVEIEDALFALQEEHLPADLQQRARMLVNDLVGLGSDSALAELARLYRALVEALPEHVSQIRAAFDSTIFEDCRSEDEEWWEGFHDQP